MITTQYSLWFLPLCLLVGLAYAALLYWKAPKPELTKPVKIVAAVCRSVLVALITFLLLNPLVKRTQKEVEKPIIALGIDNSQSLLIGSKADYYKGDYQTNLAAFITKLQRDYQVVPFLIGDSLQQGAIPDFDDGKTDLTAFFQQMEAAYSYKNLGAMVLLSDGIYNVGQSPFFYAQRLKSPIYTVMMGDTTVKKDLLIAKINVNKTVYLNNMFPLEIMVKADKLNGKTTQLKVYQGEKVVFERSISISSDAFTQWIRTSFEAKSSGLLRYRVTLSVLEGEITEVNNKQDVLVEVLDQRKKVAIVYYAPHPDVSAICQSLEANDHYQVESFAYDKFISSIQNYDMLVLHQLPSIAEPATALIDAIKKTAMPVWYILGKQTNYAQFNAYNLGLQIQENRSLQNDAHAVVNKNFSNFTLSPALEDIFVEMPPLNVPFGKYKVSPSANVLLYQKIGAVSTNYPVLLFNQGQEHRSAILIGEGFWRWRLYNYMMEANHDAFDELVSKLFQFIATKADKSFFRVKTKQVFAENEHIIFDAELYNDNYELVNEPEVNLLVEEQDEKYSYAFSRSAKAYTLDAGQFPVGDYTWTAKTDFNGQQYRKSGYFSVQKINLEAVNTVADHQLLHNIATQSDAMSFEDNQFDALYQAIEDNENIKSVVHYKSSHRSLLDSVYLLLLLFLLLAAEWGLRKWSGTY